MSSFPPDAIRRICIIGAGVSGLCAARRFLGEENFDTIDVFEQRSTVGGVWNINLRTAQPTPVPQEDPNWDGDRVPARGVRTPSERDGQDQGPMSKEEDETAVAELQESPEFHSPLYPSLETNIPHQMMGFSTLNFVETQKAVSDDKTKDPQLPLLIPYHMVTSYLRHYSIPLLPYIQFSTQVVSVVPIPDQSATGKSFPPLTKWQVTTKHLPTNKTTTHSLYDALIISNGHYTVPYLPAIRGIEAFSSKYPDNISHSRDFRTEAPFTNCKTVMIGNSASAIDIGQQISHVCSGPLIRVVRTNNPGNDPNCYLSLEEFIADGEDSDTSKGGSIKFLRPDGSSHIEHGVQKVLFATGYLYTLPFLNAQAPDTSTTTSSSIPLLPPTGHYLRSLYLYFLSTTHPTLSILNTPMKILPFPLAEAQVSVLTRLYLGKIPLPLPSEMQTWETQTIAKKGPGKSFMVLNEPAEDLEYCNGLVDWANQAEDKTEGKPENEPTARPRSTSQTRLPRLPLPPKYTKKQKWLRTMFPEIRRRFMERGDRRKEVRTWEDLGIWWEGGDEEGEGRVE